MPTTLITGGHRSLLDVLVQLACYVAMADTKEPHGHVPDDLQDIMRALQRVNDSDPLRQSKWIVESCASALIFIARHEPDLFPKPVARAIVYALDPVKLWNIASGDDRLDVQGIDVERIAHDFFGHSKRYLLEHLNACTPNAMELLIAPQTFGQILDAYEEQVGLKRYADVVACV
jgi:hypothetical protein